MLTSGFQRSHMHEHAYRNMYTHVLACVQEHVHTCNLPIFKKMRVLIHVKSKNIKVPEYKIMYFGGTSP